MEKGLDWIITIIFILALGLIGYFGYKGIKESMDNKKKTETSSIEEGDDLDDNDSFDPNVDDYDYQGEDLDDEDVAASTTIPSSYDDESGDIAASIIKDIVDESEEEEDSSTKEPETIKTPTSKEKEPTVKKENTVPTTSSTITYNGTDNFLLVVGTFSSKKNAEVRSNIVKKLGYTPEIVNFKNSTKFSVIAARYSSESSAKEAESHLKNNKVECYIHRKRKE